ncbi:MAG TPA: J domain-containing protein [Alphaproteobacteria bacterium]|nr:J domain-containing protein [Alphaproteobacteria bacterium]
MQRAYSVFDFGDHETEPVRACDSPGCTGEGLYRAPKAPERLRDYHWFCLDHVREYNKAWNFCAGLSESQIEALIRNDTSWERPTRPMSHWFAHEQKLRAAASAYAAGEERQARTEWDQRARQREREAQTPEAAALRTLGLTTPVTYASIKARYIELVKRHHPDRNGGDKGAEERLKTINQALQTLKAVYLE